MSEFKIGDRVRCINDSDTDCVKSGQEYDVTGVDAPYIYVREDGEESGMYAYRFELVPTFAIATDKFYRTRNGKVTGRVSKGDTGFEAVVDGKVRIYDAAGGHVHGDADLDIVEAWVPRVGELVRFVRDNTDGGAEYGAKGEVVTVMSEASDVGNCQIDVSSSHFKWHPGAYLSDLEPLPVAAPAQPAATLKIEAGKFYRTRDGRKVGPLMTTDDNEYWPFKWPEQTMYYKADGYSCPGSARLHRDQDDLIAEWHDTPSAPVAAMVDAIAEEYGPVVAASRPKFKVGDRVVFRNYSGGEHCYGTVEDVSMDGKRVLASDWSIGAEVGYLPVADLELAETRPDTTLHIKFTSDFSELDAAILVRKKKLKKLIKLARKAGIELREAA